MPDGRWLLLHGTPLTPAVWDDVRTSLSADREVLAPRLPVPASPVEAQAVLADAIVSSIDQPQRPLHVVGHSFGGQVALEVALRHPERVATLTILCSRASPFPAFSGLAASVRSGEPIDVDAGLARWLAPDELAADGPVVRYARRCLTEVDRSMWADELDAIAAYDRMADLRSLQVPATLLAASLDGVGTPMEMAEMAKAIPVASYVVIGDAAHLSPFCDPPRLAKRLNAAAARR